MATFIVTATVSPEPDEGTKDATNSETLKAMLIAAIKDLKLSYGSAANQIIVTDCVEQ